MPPQALPPGLRLGDFRVSPDKLLDGPAPGSGVKLPGLPEFSLPALSKRLGDLYRTVLADREPRRAAA